MSSIIDSNIVNYRIFYYLINGNIISIKYTDLGT